MPELSRAQLAVYAAVAIVILMLGARWIRADQPPGAGAEPASAGVADASQSTESDGEESFAATDGDLVVHVAGEVRKPGVYRMSAGSRVTDAIERAGGTTGAAAADAINLAAPLADGQQISIPAKSQGPAGATGGPAAPGDPASGPVSLGSATVEQLDTIEGIGPVTAAAIIEFRDERGGVASIDELDEISGIGPATMEALRASLQP